MHSTTRARLILLLAAAVLLLSGAPAARAQETDDEREFGYIPDTENGPRNWSSLNTSWAKCNKGGMQSPIDLTHESVKPMHNLGYLDYSYRPAEASMVNRGHDIEVKFMGNTGRVVINRKAYQLKQLHWHSPSEHAVNGRRYDMELHLVHDDENNNTAVIGILYLIGNPDAFLLTLEPFIRRIADTKDKSEQIGVVDPQLVKNRDAVYYRYMGSLTTPPCMEGVIWTIFKRGYENNARPLQKLNNRNISIFIPNPLRKD
uniref:Carbonic anhydrase n=1 Tax=Oryza punctata TaxID=4537 RepID=A0A0E0LVT1_ORYPU